MNKRFTFSANTNTMKYEANAMRTTSMKNQNICIGFDLDGTLLFNGEWKAWVPSLVNQLQGYDTFFATGRSILECKKLMQVMKRDIPIICDDGQYIYDNENGYAYNTFLSLCEEFDYFEKNDILIAVETKDSICTESSLMKKLLTLYCGVDKNDIRHDNPRTCKEIYKVYFYEKNRLIQGLGTNFNITTIVAGFGYLTDRNVNKYEALQKALKDKNLQTKNTLYFGDGLNDMEIIRNVPVGVAVYNAIPELKEISTITMKSDMDFMNFLSYLKMTRRSSNVEKLLEGYMNNVR